MKYFLTFLLLICFKFFSAQESDTTQIQILEFGINFNERNEKLLLVYADSINKFDGKNIPSYLHDPCLDFKNIFKLSIHNRESKRWKILSKVTKREALKSILEINDKKLKKVCKNKFRFGKKIKSEIDLIELSFETLIKKRIDQLEYINNLQGNEKKHYERNILIDSIAVSLNNYTIEDCIEVPAFFKDYDFDISVGSRYLMSNQSVVSLRKVILEKVDNLDLLKCVLKLNDVKISQISSNDVDFSNNPLKIPFQEYSTFELVKFRVEEIENNRKLSIGLFGQEK